MQHTEANKCSLLLPVEPSMDEHSVPCWPHVRSRHTSLEWRRLQPRNSLAFIFFLVSIVIGGEDHGVCVHDGAGCTIQAERHWEVDAQAAIKISVANAIHPPSSQYGVHDADFLKGNIVEVRQGHYEAYFSERVWSENAQHFTITLLVEVFGYDMGARFKDFAADAARSCVTLQMPDDYDNPFGQGDAIICGQKSYSCTSHFSSSPFCATPMVLSSRNQTQRCSSLLHCPPGDLHPCKLRPNLPSHPTSHQNTTAHHTTWQVRLRTGWQ